MANQVGWHGGRIAAEANDQLDYLNYFINESICSLCLNW